MAEICSIAPDRIADLLVPFVGSLADHQVTAVKTYVDLLLRWNAKLNLTAIRDSQEMITRHFGESLFAARQLFPNSDSCESVIDVGSGAGFPGLPLKLWSQNIDLTLVESNHRKATFMREVIRTLHLKSATVLTDRAESISLHADVVTLRAVERFEQILPIAFGLIKPGGKIGLLIGEAQVALAEASLPQVMWLKPIHVPLTHNGKLLIGEASSA